MSSTPATTSAVAPPRTRSATRALVIQYNKQLTLGCGELKCQNVQYCKSAEAATEHTTLQTLTKKQALTRAIKCVKAHDSVNHLCSVIKTVRPLDSPSPSQQPEKKSKIDPNSNPSPPPVLIRQPSIEETAMSFADVETLFASCQQAGDFKHLIRRIGFCFGDKDTLNDCFVTTSPEDMRSPNNTTNVDLTDQSLRPAVVADLDPVAQQSEAASIEQQAANAEKKAGEAASSSTTAATTATTTTTDSSAASSATSLSMDMSEDVVAALETKTNKETKAGTHEFLFSTIKLAPRVLQTLLKSWPQSHYVLEEGDTKYLQVSYADPYLDLDQLDGFYKLVNTQPNVLNALLGALSRMVRHVEVSPMQITTAIDLRFFLLVLALPIHNNPNNQAIIATLGQIFIKKLKPQHVATLKFWLLTWDRPRTMTLLNALQQYITVNWYQSMNTTKLKPAVELLGLVYEVNELRTGLITNLQQARRANLMVHSQQEAILKHELFYNTALNDDMDILEEFKRWRSNGQLGYSVATQPCLLDPGAKAELFRYEAIMEQKVTQSNSIRNMFMGGYRSSRFLILHVHRTNLIYTTLDQVQHMSGTELKKPLKVIFAGEEGIDEGGLRKEYFQLMMAQLVDAKYGMFTTNTDTRNFWFNPDSYESSEQFELVGTMIGLGIYNGVILDIRFPQVIYKKLMGVSTSIEDLQDCFPDLYQGFQTLLGFEGDVEDVYCRNFDVTRNVFGGEVVFELCEGGKDRVLTNENREEYVSLYVDYLLNKSIATQFNSFRKGFQKLISMSYLKLFRSEEIELVICGSPHLDFEELRDNARYEDGFEEDDDTIELFWEVVEEMSMTDKKKLLEFVTGSDRAPVKGLGSLTFIISKNGDDSDRLPTSHTCFNHLLLPGYTTKARMENRLKTAIQNARGFGMK